MGDRETALGRKWPSDLVNGESRCKADRRDVSKERNACRTGWLLRYR